MTDVESTLARPFQPAKARETEGIVRGAAKTVKAGETAKQRGRPKGSKNKVKALMTNEFHRKLKGERTPADYAYLENVVKNGARIDVLKEITIMFAVLGRNILPMMLEEMQADEETGDKYFRKDVTERLKVWQSLGNTIHQIEKGSDEGTSDREKPILKVFENRGIDAGRLRILIGIESDSMGISVDGVGGEQVRLGAVPDQLPERPLDVSDSEQEPTVGVLNDDRVGDDPRGLHETEL